MNVSIFGRLTRDPEVKTSPTGVTYTNITVATQLPIKDPNGGGRKSLFVGVTAFGKQGEAVAQYFRKGSRIVVDGNINDVNIGQGQNGQSYLNFYVNMSNFHIVDTKTETEAQGAAHPAAAPGYGAPPSPGYAAQPPAAPTAPQGYAAQPPAPPTAPGYGAPRANAAAPWAPPATEYAGAPY